MSFLSRLFGRSTPSEPAQPVVLEERSRPEGWQKRAPSQWYVPDDIVPEQRWLDENGRLLLRLVPYTDSFGNHVLRLREPSGMMIAPPNRHVRHVGIWMAKVRGESFNAAGCQAGDFRPGATLTVRRDPQNKADPNAVEVRDASGAHRCGFYNKGKARMMTKVMDAGLRMSAISLRGTAAGEPCKNVTVLAAPPELMDQLLQPVPADWAPLVAHTIEAE